MHFNPSTIVTNLLLCCLCTCVGLYYLAGSWVKGSIFPCPVRGCAWRETSTFQRKTASSG